MSDRSGTVPKIQEILARYGEMRPLSTKEVDMDAVVAAALDLAMRLDEVDGFSDGAHLAPDAFTESIREWLAVPVKKDRGRQAIQAEIDPQRPSSLIVRNVLDAADRSAGVVALHLVGALLHILLGDSGVVVENRGSMSPDDLHTQPGDFLVGDTAFHVTMTPGHLVVEHCVGNIVSGLKPYLLVPEQYVEMSRGLALMQGVEKQVFITGIETFVGQSVDAMGGFGRDRLETKLRLLLETYNTRVQAVETDPSLLIEIPENLS